ncbi:MAG: hypothetical protein K8T91_14100 [Planctomycetes bacterium]|nr:hypothetical protein [Planctomycetota bacterium]
MISRNDCAEGARVGVQPSGCADQTTENNRRAGTYGRAENGEQTGEHAENIGRTSGEQAGEQRENKISNLLPSNKLRRRTRGADIFLSTENTEDHRRVLDGNRVGGSDKFVDVHEKGIEAAAATVVRPAPANGHTHTDPAANFNADHPFVFLIRENRTGSILFVGRVTDQRGS